MKQDKNNQIDILLRSLARSERGDSPLESTRENRAVSDHLDADELNCFAEGVVPAPARARYIAHLADCESCRGFVVNLTQASGAAARYETPEQQTGSGFWRKMAALFSPPVLRYAVPAMALTAVIAISFFALRQQRRPELVAQNQPTNSAAPSYTKEQPTESPVAQSKNEGPAKIQSGVESRARVDSSSDKKSFQDDRSSVAQVPAETTGAEVPTSSSLKDSAQSKQGYVAGARPTFAPEPQAAPPPAKAALSEADKTHAFQKEELARREVQEAPREEEKNQPRDEAGRHGPSRSNVTLLPGSKRADGLMTERGEPKARSKKDSDEERETRTVSGKRFRHQGSAWIDTAYDSSGGTINISRGSEQFRALVADEPGIGTIAEQLNGAVIVVWKGRAYRIQ